MFLGSERAPEPNDEEEDTEWQEDKFKPPNTKYKWEPLLPEPYDEGGDTELQEDKF